MKKIVIVTDSTTNFLKLALRLKNNFEIIWLTYHREVYLELKKSNFKKIYFCDIAQKIQVNFFFKKFVQKIFDKILNIFHFKKIDGFLKKIEIIEKKENPFCFITDSFNLLIYYKTKKIKMSFGHSVCYKNFFLQEINLSYDYLFLPGYYHLNRLKKYFRLKKTSNLKVLGSLKLLNLKKKNIKKRDFNNKLKLKHNINILFAPTHDAHDITQKFRLLPKAYGNQIEKLEKLIIFLDKLKANLIIKLHHYHNNKLPNEIFQKYKNVHIFKTRNFFDTKESSIFIRNSDIIISDNSGVATSGIFLDKKMIFIEPTEPKWDWEKADIEKNLRPGYICNNFDELKRSLINYLSKKDNFKNKRNKFISKIFYKPNKDATIEIAKFIRSIS